MDSGACTQVGAIRTHAAPPGLAVSPTPLHAPAPAPESWQQQVIQDHVVPVSSSHHHVVENSNLSLTNTDSDSKVRLIIWSFVGLYVIEYYLISG